MLPTMTVDVDSDDARYSRCVRCVDVGAHCAAMRAAAPSAWLMRLLLLRRRRRFPDRRARDQLHQQKLRRPPRPRRAHTPGQPRHRRRLRTHRTHHRSQDPAMIDRSLRHLAGVVAPLLRDNIDTDVIAPSRLDAHPFSESIPLPTDEELGAGHRSLLTRLRGRRRSPGSSRAGGR